MERAEKRGISHAPLFSSLRQKKSDGFMISFSKEACFFRETLGSFLPNWLPNPSHHPFPFFKSCFQNAKQSIPRQNGEETRKFCGSKKRGKRGGGGCQTKLRPRKKPPLKTWGMESGYLVLLHFLKEILSKKGSFPPVLPLIFSTHAPFSHSRKTGFILYFSFIRPPISGRFGSTSVVCSNYSNLDRPSVSPTNFSRHFESR